MAWDGGDDPCAQECEDGVTDSQDARAFATGTQSDRHERFLALVKERGGRTAHRQATRCRVTREPVSHRLADPLRILETASPSSEEKSVVDVAQVLTDAARVGQDLTGLRGREPALWL